MKVEKFPIPSVFTYHWKGAEIVELIRKHGPRKVRIALQEGSHCRTTSQVIFPYKSWYPSNLYRFVPQ